MSAESASYAKGPQPQPLLVETIGANLERTVAAHGERTALISRHQQIRLTYEELDAEVDRVARALIAAGIERGDRLGLWSPNRAEWALLQYATAKLGVILVNVNPAYRAHELAYAARQSGCRMLVAAKAFKASDYVAMVDEVRGELDALERVVFFDDPSWEELIASGDGVDPGAVAERSGALAPEDAINIQYTSGTTGFPKGATLSHVNILNNGFFVGEGCRITERDLICVPVPYYHCFGMVMGNLAAISHGAAVVLPDEAFEPRSVLDAVSAERCTALYGVPTMFIAELAELEAEPGRWDLSSLRTGIMAGSPCPVETMRAVISEMHMNEVTICYGMTETSPVSAQTGFDDELELRVSTVGTVHPHVEVRVADPESGGVLGRGETGEFQTRGYSVMIGYWEDPERTAEAIDGDGWMHTGDQATMDDDRLPEDRRADQGHGDPGRRERLPARGRGVPARPPRRPRRPGRRRPRRAVRRGALRLGAAARRRRLRAGRPARVLQGPDRPLQGAALRSPDRRVPDDRHRQGPEVQAPRPSDRGARPPRPHRHRLSLNEPKGV